MTKKDYIVIAGALRQQIEAWPATGNHTNQAVGDVLRETARVVADRLAVENPRFNRQTFLAACGAE